MSAKNELLEKEENIEKQEKDVNSVEEKSTEATKKDETSPNNNSSKENTENAISENSSKDNINDKNLEVENVSTDDKNNENIEEREEKEENENNKESTNTKFSSVKEDKNTKKKSKFFHIFKIVILSLIAILILTFGVFTIYNMFNSNIIYGVYIKDVNVSGMSESDARYQLENYLPSKLPQEIRVKHGDFETTISLAQIEASFDIKTATQDAFKVGRTGNPLQNNFYVLSTMFANVTIEPKLNINTEQLTTNLNEISTQLPDKVIQSSYYQEGNNLIITSGKEGSVIDIEPTIEAIKTSISNFSCIDNPIELVVKTEQPAPIDIDKIHTEIYKEAVNASYTTNPFTVIPSENGLDFNISIDEAKAIINSEKKDEYSIPLKVIYPAVTTSMIGTEAFPDMLSTYSTRYSTRDRDRTTNLQLAASKINGTVLMPGETFSYNQVVGERTISAGYKEAPIYVNGEVVDGLGGGICQITSTLYNAVLYANLEIVERSNHQFIPSYVTASRDATVVYGSIDFKFKNNRDYPIKLICSVSGGIARFDIYGLRTDNEYEVEISSYVTGSTANSTYSEAYRILKQNGQVISTELLSKDTYKRH